MLAVGVAYRAVPPRGQPLVTGQLAIVGKGPVTAPQFAGKGVGVFQGDTPPVRLPDMADHGTALDGQCLDQLGDGRLGTGFGILEGAKTPPLIEGDPPAILVGTGLAAPQHQPGKAEADVGRHIGAHAEQFAHIPSTP